ncbi:MAG: hypothetical protein IJT02_09940 [Synergistaceae bacterium]|nr:hypothetical protein [Synergistaceae bacterium]
MKNYEDFADELNAKIKSDDDFCYELLITVIRNPQRYTGIFRVSNAKTKLIQNVTQSREIKFGDFMEDLITWYISEMGYENLDKHISNNLEADQLFRKGRAVYLIEQKIRDDHDSTKKRGQYDNFRLKYLALQEKHPDCEINAVMWFIDGSLRKNRKYYLERAEAEAGTGITIHIIYDGELFTGIFARPDVWEELCSHLARNKLDRTDEVLSIPDFDTSSEILLALIRLKTEQRNLYERLLSSRPEYVQLRAELFPTGTNLSLSQTK